MSDNIKKGGISVDTEHIFPIIKKWLYSEKDIFLREIVSNATDAVTKYKRLQSLGQIPSDECDYRITISLDKDAATISVSDNGIGMSAEELETYICNIALSGAFEFIQKYEGEGGSNGIIGHFGLGFYSAFMVSDQVEIYTKSFTDAPGVHWVCDESGSYSTEPCDKQDRGTTVIMHITEQEREYLDNARLSGMLRKYCAFMPVEIYFEDADAENSASSAPINDTTPLWQANPSDCTDEQYKDFYNKVFTDFKEPLFHIHINADYPLNFKGILYFPRISSEYESIEGQVKLYYNQVFVADNIKEVIPDYLLMLRGVLDCPELPLNVSRSYLQNNTYVTKVGAHIVKKVADKLNSLCNLEREQYERIWGDIRIFVEYASIRDRKFYERIKGSLLLSLTDGSCKTIDQYLEDAKQKHEGVIYYTTDKALQAQYISMYTAQGIEVAVFEKSLDAQFMSALESYRGDVKFQRIDSDVAEALKGDGEVTDQPALTELFRKVSGNAELGVTYQPLKDTSVPAMLNVSEESSRMAEMMRMYAMTSGNSPMQFPLEYSLVVNTGSSLYQKLQSLSESDSQKAELIARQIYALSVLAQRKLNASELKEFLADSFSLLELL
ncbi:MAG: molecular chaperone HtpG [Ruminococcaceae bacterium]|nr:molecular chaperone HtpG [Oscillospiraceae bacterium]